MEDQICVGEGRRKEEDRTGRGEEKARRKRGRGKEKKRIKQRKRKGRAKQEQSKRRRKRNREENKRKEKETEEEQYFNVLYLTVYLIHILAFDRTFCLSVSLTIYLTFSGLMLRIAKLSHVFTAFVCRIAVRI